MVTKFGKFTRNLRMDKGELLYDMAKRLAVSPAFLSRVEHGKAKPPVHWKEILISEYQLKDAQVREFVENLNEARVSVIILDKYTQEEQLMLRSFANQLGKFTDKERQTWKEILKLV